MTEASWLWADPNQLIEELNRRHVSDRKQRLLLAGCCRIYWTLIQPYPSLCKCVTFAESFADGHGDRSELSRHKADNLATAAPITHAKGKNFAVAFVAALARGACELGVHFHAPWIDSHLKLAKRFSDDPSQPDLSFLIRDIFGNPFRPVPFEPAWLTPTVVAFANGIYADRAFDRMPILEEAGCDNVDVLLHCRGDGPHVRGCWVVDSVLGKE